ncbi:Tautomerase [Penicillium sp. DV-2018c]|nr:Tautomerase [Penicillium sp. DV-2018c]
MDASKKKQPLPRLKTNVPLLEQSSNAACNALPLEALPDATTSPTILPEIPPKSSSLIRPMEENVPPAAHGPDISTLRLSQRGPADDSPLTTTKKPFYDDMFSLRGSPNSPKDRVTYGCVFVAEVKTNIKAKQDARYILSELVHRLAQLYDRPEAHMLVTIDQNADLVFGTPVSTEAYLLKISAHSSMVTPLVNARITNNMQCTLEQLLGITPDKGIVIFIPVIEENLGRNGTTAWAEINRLEKVSSTSPSVFRSLSRSMSRRIKPNSGTMSLSSPGNTDVATGTPTSTVAFAAAETTSQHSYQPYDQSPTDRSETGKLPKGEQEQASPAVVKPGDTLGKKASLKYILSRLSGSGSGERKSRKVLDEFQKEN